MIRVFVLFLLFISPVSLHAQKSAGKDEARRQIPQTIPHRVLSDAQIEQYRKENSYQPVLQDEFFRLLQQQEQNAQINHSIVQRAKYSATLSGNALLNGQIAFHLKEGLEPDQVRRKVSLGVTSLEKVRLFSGNEKLNLSTDSKQNLICLGDLESPVITGTWILQGTPVGQATVFQMNLPAASLCELSIETNSDIEVTSSNALVRRRDGETGTSEWTLYPEKSTTVTISCARRTEDLRAEAVGLTVLADCRVQKYGSVAKWNVGVPNSLTDAILLFGFSGECDVQSVTLSNGSPLRWDIFSLEEQEQLRVWVPSAQAELSFDIESSMSGSEDSVVVPFLIPESWQPALSEIGGALLLRGSTIRVTMSPDFVVTDVKTDGVFEQQVQFLTDDSQLLIFEQFAQSAHVRLSTVLAEPVIEDSIVVLPSGQPGVADAYVSVVAKSGSTGTLQYDVPNSWRVTEVSEPATGIPVLFRLSDSRNSDNQSTLHVTLRTPLMAGRVQAVQQLAIQLQSTTGQLQREIPTLVNKGYQRVNDYVVLTEERRGVRRLPGVKGILLKELRTQLPWLPVTDSAEQFAFARSDLQVTSDSAAAAEQSVATLDYSVSASSGIVTETVKLNLQSPSELPSEILVRVTSGVELNLKTDSNAPATAVLRRISAGRKYDDWQLRISRRGSSLREFLGELSTSRPLVDSMNAMMIEIPRSVSKGGTVRPPVDDAVLLLDAEDRPVRLTQQYPDNPFDDSLRLQIPVEESLPLSISGNAFLIAEVVPNGLRVQARYQLNVRSGQASGKLEMLCPDVESFGVFVDGKPVYPDVLKDLYEIPLGAGPHPMSIDVFVVTNASQQPENVFDISVMTLPKAGSTQLNYFVLTPENRTAASDGAVVQTQAGALAAVTRIITDSNQQAFSDYNRQHQQFASRWQLHAARPQIACLIATPPAGNVLQIRLSDRRFDSLKTLMTMLCVLSLLLVLFRISRMGWWLTAVVMLVLVVASSRVPEVLWPYVEGAIYGTVTAGIVSLLKSIQWKRLYPRGRAAKIGLQSLVVLCWLTIPSAHGFDEEPLPQVLVPDSGLPVVYVADDWLTQLRMSAQPESNDALVVAVRLKLELLSPVSAAVEIECDVATRADQASELILPLNGLTLVGCTLDGRAVFPTRNSAGETAIVIPPRSLLPSTQLTDDESKVATAGPETIGSSVRRSVRYTVRLVPEVAGDTLQFLIPHPASPEARLVVADPGNIAATANRIGATGVVADFRNQQVVFAPVFNSRLFDVAVRLKKTDDSVSSPAPLCEIVCRAEVAPAEVRLTCEYRNLPVDQKTQTVRIGGYRKYRVTAVESLGGQRLQWSIDREELVVQVDAELSDMRALKVQRVTETAMSLRQVIPLQEIATVNGVRAEMFTLSASTSGLFFVDAVMVGDVPLVEMPASTLPTLPDGLRATDRVISVPSQTTAVEVQLAAQQTTREARLIQDVVVTKQEIQWSCRCEIEIAGQPAFRQTLQLSPNVQIQSVTASNGDVSRLHSWFRNDDLITISLREGIRGSLDLEIKGTVKREPNVDTPLPTIGRPIEILEYLLRISSSPGLDIYISDLAGNVPHSPIDIQATPIPDKPDSPMTLSVTDEGQPLIIRANPERRITGQLAVVAYESNDQAFLAQYLKLHTPDAAFVTPFEIPKAAAFATSGLWISQSGEFQPLSPASVPEAIRVSALVDGSVVVGITEIVMARDSDRLALPIPDFGSEVTITSLQAFDLRSEQVTASIPDWLRTATSQTGLASGVQGGRLLDSRFDAETQEIEVRIAPVQQTKEIRSSPSGPLFATVDHQVRVPGEKLITGLSGFLVFSMQERQRIGIQVPIGTLPTAVRVDGTALPFSVDQNEISVSASGRVSFVAVDWVRGLRGPMAERSKLPLPQINAVQTSVFASALKHPESDWGLSNTSQDSELIVKDRLRSLTTGLQIIESETLTDEQTAIAASPDSQSDFPTGPVWEKLALESSEAALEFVSFLNDADVTPLGMRRVYVTEAEELRFTSSGTPSVLVTLSLLFAAMMFLVPIVVRGRVSRPVLAEASTIVTQPRTAGESEGPTMIGVDSAK